MSSSRANIMNLSVKIPHSPQIADSPVYTASSPCYKPRIATFTPTVDDPNNGRPGSPSYEPTSPEGLYDGSVVRGRFDFMDTVTYIKETVKHDQRAGHSANLYNEALTIQEERACAMDEREKEYCKMFKDVEHLATGTQRMIKALFKKAWNSAIRSHKDAIERTEYMKEVYDEFNLKRKRDDNRMEIMRPAKRMMGASN